MSSRVSNHPPGGVPAEGGRGPIAFAALRHRDFRPYFVGTMLSMMGDNTEHVISYWVMFQAFHSPLLAGFAVISHWTPALLLSVYAGALADRFDCRRIIQAGQALFMTVSITWGVLFLTNSLQVWHAVVLLTLHGLSGVLWNTPSQLILYDMVGPDHLQSAVRLSATARQLGMLFGPAVGGGLMLLLGPAVGLLANALLYLPLTIWLLTVPYTGHHRQSARVTPRPAVSLWEAPRVLREVSGDRTILAMVALVGFGSLLVGNAYLAQMPEFVQDLVGDKTGLLYSVLLMAEAAGAIVGALLLESSGLLRPRARTAILCASLWSLAMGGFAVARSYPLAFALLFLAGVCNLTFGAMAQTLVQLRAPVAIRGRVVGLFNMSQLGLRLGAGVTVGVLGSLIGIHWSLGLSALALLAVTLGLLAFARGSEAKP